MIVGKTNSPEIGLWPFTEGPAFGATRNPWSLGHTPGRILGRIGGRGRRRARTCRGRVRRRRLGPNPRCLDPSGRHQAPARADLHLARSRGLQGPHGHRPARPHRRRRRAAAGRAQRRTSGDLHRPPPPSMPYSSVAARPPGPLRIALALNVLLQRRPARLDPEIRGAVERMARGGSKGSVTRSRWPESPMASGRGQHSCRARWPGSREWAGRVPDRIAARPPRARQCPSRPRVRPLLGIANRAERSPGAGSAGSSATSTSSSLRPRPSPRLPVGACEGLSAWETDKAIVAACPYAWPWNVLGWPGINVPAGFTADGLPVGAQLLGPANSEPLLLSLASQLEDEVRWFEQRPQD